MSIYPASASRKYPAVSSYFFVLIGSVLLFACSGKDKDAIAPATVKQPVVILKLGNHFKQDTITGIITVADLPGDTAFAVLSSFTPVLLSLEQNSIIDTSRLKTNSWDIIFYQVYNSYLAPNDENVPSGAQQVLWKGSTGKAKLMLVDKPFDSVYEAPEDNVFAAAAEIQYEFGWYNSRGYVQVPGYPLLDNGWYQYSMATHVCKPLPGKTFVIKTNGGHYAKLEMISVYKGNPANPDKKTPAPYLHFRYYVQQDGSRNLKTTSL